MGAMRTHDGNHGAAGRRGLWMAVVVAVLVVLGTGIGAWLWAGRPDRSDLSVYELPAQSDRRYTRDDIIAMVDDCNERISATGGATASDGAGDPDATATAGTGDVAAPPFTVEDTDATADDNAHPPTTVTMTIPAAESAEPLRSQPFRCMAKALSMPQKTRRDLAKQAEAFDSGEGAMPMAWNDLGFRGWKSSDGTFHLRITWYDPAAGEG